jgi:MscS family membrane protein
MTDPLHFPILHIELWRWLTFVLILSIAILFSKGIEWLVGKRIRAWTLQNPGDADTIVVDVVTPIIRWGILLFAAHTALRLFPLSPETDATITMVFKAGYTLLVAYLLTRIADIFLKGWAGRSRERQNIQLHQNLVSVISKLVRGFIYVMALLLILQNAGYNVGSLIAGLGIGGLAIALGAQETLANLFGTIAIFVDKPFIVGEQVQVEKYDGHVEKVGLRSTQIRQADGTLVSIPNKIMAQSSVNNVSRRLRIRHTMTLQLACDTSAAKMEEALRLLRDLFASRSDLHDFQVYWQNYGLSSLDLPIILWFKTTDGRGYLESLEQINLEIKKRFEAAGLEFALPAQTLYLKKSEPSS